MAITRDMLEIINKIILSRDPPQYQTRIKLGVWDEESPTERDKPSPSSSLSKQQAISMALKDFPEDKGYMVAEVSNTNSMEPYLDNNTVVVLEKLDYEWGYGRLKRQPLKVGDIIVWTTGSSYIIHRIKKISEKGIVTQGDNNKLPDLWGEYIPLTYVVGRLIQLTYCQQKNMED